MANLAPIDKVEIHVLVDNATDSLSTIPAHAESEFAYLERHGMRELSGDYLCCACHGLSLLITATRGEHRHTVLFDSGPEEYAFERNSTRLGVDLGTVESIVLSHRHWDHSGGILKALDLIRSRHGGRAIPYYAHPGMFRSRARRLPNGTMFPIKDVPTIEALTAHGGQVNCTREPQVFIDSMFYLSGEIPRVTPFERGLPAHYQKNEEGNWAPDPLLIDERFLMVNVAGKGLVVFTACSHAGLVKRVEACAHPLSRSPALCCAWRVPSRRPQRKNNSADGAGGDGVQPVHDCRRALHRLARRQGICRRRRRGRVGPFSGG
jgi:7,8-dihydropterin-6-yl-methyl-4-(beta-D-ribofuranosyl)aminobenzene 5'-phosphate synthase